jgi:hypothetical protein
MVGILTSPPVPMVKGRVRHCGRVKHCIKTIDLYIYLFTVLRQQRSELVNDHPGGQGIVGRRSVDLLAMPLDPTKFFMKHLRVIPESLPPVVRGIAGCTWGDAPPPPEVAPSTASSSDSPESSCRL